MENDKDAARASRAALAIAAAVCAGFALSGTAVGQENDSLNVDVGECVKLESPGERLDCYERQVKRAQTAPAAPAPLPAPATVPAPAAPPIVAAPPAAPPQVAAPPPAAPSAAAPSAAPSRSVRVEDARVAAGAGASSPALGGTIVALREIVPNRWLITLQNGQVWRQTFAEPYPLKIGQRVELKQARRSRSSYELAVVGLNGDIQVELVR